MKKDYSFEDFLREIGTHSSDPNREHLEALEKAFQVRLAEKEEIEEERLFGVGLLQLCEGLRMQSNGSADPWDKQEEERVQTYLKKRLSSWHASQAFNREYDDAVFAMVRACLRELKERREND